MSEDHPREPYRPDAPEEHSFDQLARGLASGSVSRKQAMKLLGGALLGGVLASLPGVAWATHWPLHGGGGGIEGGTSGSQVCTAPKVNVRGRCVCPSTCRWPKVQNSTTCACECTNTCSGGRILNPNTCQCECPSGQAECSGACVDLNTDINNCGSCGNTCSQGASCVGGTCEGAQEECPTGQTDCGGYYGATDSYCVDLNTDVSNCGACGNTCPEGASCVAGTCEGGQGGCTPEEDCGSNGQCGCIVTAEGTSFCTSATGFIICDAMTPCTSSAECPEGWACSEGYAFGPCPGLVCWSPCEG